METRLKCKVVMLPTNEKADDFVETKNRLCFDVSEAEICIVSYPNRIRMIPQHLYFTSNREIRNDGDWYYNIFTKSIFLMKEHTDYKTVSDKKIEATTDTSLNLPLIPQSFVEKYVQLQGKIDEVEIEMDVFDCTANGVQKTIVDVKTRTDNTVIVHKVKDTWTREEVEELCRRALSDGTLFCMPNFRGKVLTSNEWIEENL